MEAEGEKNRGSASDGIRDGGVGDRGERAGGTYGLEAPGDANKSSREVMVADI